MGKQQKTPKPKPILTETMFETMKEVLKSKHPYTSKLGKRNVILPGVSIKDWASGAGTERGWLSKTLTHGSKRMSVGMARALSNSAGWGKDGYDFVEEFINEVARRKEKVYGREQQDNGHGAEAVTESTGGTRSI